MAEEEQLPAIAAPDEEGPAADEEEVEADKVVQVTQATVETIRARQAHLSMSAVRTIHVEQAELENSAVLRLDAGEVEAEESAIGLAQADVLRMEEVQAGLISGQEVVAQECASWAIIGGTVHVEGGRNLVVIGKHLDGAVQPLLDLRGAAVLGVAAGLTAVLVLLLRQALRRRRR